MSEVELLGVRTWMYVPADQRRKLDKSVTSGADVILADLEDAVAPDQKAAAREVLAGWLDDVSGIERPRIWVRVNASTVEADLAVASHRAVEGVCLPKAESPDQVVAADELLARFEPAGSSGRPLMLMIETARGVIDCEPIAAASPRVGVLQLGEQDLSADLGLPPAHVVGGRVASPLQAARNAVVFCSAALGLARPVGPVSTEIHDRVRLTEDSRALRADGFGSRAVIHPAQVAPVSEAFAPGEAELEWAEQVVAAAEAARREGLGVVAVDGRMVDAPVEALALRIVRSAGAS